jgi:hypothetical protein
MAGLAMPINGLTFTAPSGRDVTAEVLACLPSALRPCMAHCDVFAASRGGAETMAREMGIPFLGRVPLDPALGRLAESGKSLQALKDAPSFQAFDAIVVGALSAAPCQCTRQTLGSVSMVMRCGLAEANAASPELSGLQRLCRMGSVWAPLRLLYRFDEEARHGRQATNHARGVKTRPYGSVAPVHVMCDSHSNFAQQTCNLIGLSKRRVLSKVFVLARHADDHVSRVVLLCHQGPAMMVCVMARRRSW